MGSLESGWMWCTVRKNKMKMKINEEKKKEKTSKGETKKR